MFWLVLGMTLTVALAAFVVAIVALPARRAGRPVLTARGEKFFHVHYGAAASAGEPAVQDVGAPRRRRLLRRS